MSTSFERNDENKEQIICIKKWKLNEFREIKYIN